MEPHTKQVTAEWCPVFEGPHKSAVIRVHQKGQRQVCRISSRAAKAIVDTLIALPGHHFNYTTCPCCGYLMDLSEMVRKTNDPKLKNRFEKVPIRSRQHYYDMSINQIRGIWRWQLGMLLSRVRLYHLKHPNHRVSNGVQEWWDLVKETSRLPLVVRNMVVEYAWGKRV